jgi:hypothetical protein
MLTKTKSPSLKEIDEVRTKTEAEIWKTVSERVDAINADLTLAGKKDWFKIEASESNSGQRPMPGINLTFKERTLGIFDGEGSEDQDIDEMGVFCFSKNIYEAVELARQICLPSNAEYDTPLARLQGMRLVDGSLFEKLNDRLCVLKGLIQGLETVIDDSDKIQHATHGILGFQKDLDEILSTVCELQ